MATETREMSGWTSSWYVNETPIQWEVKGNPKRSHGKSYSRFEKYFGAETVGAYLENGGTKGDLKYDWQHGFLSLGSDAPAQIASVPDNEPLVALESPKAPAKNRHNANKPAQIVADVNEDEILG